MLWRQCVFVLNGGISTIKIGQKSGNPVPDFFIDNLPNSQSVFLIVLCYTKKTVDRKEKKNYTYSKLRGEYTKKDREIV